MLKKIIISLFLIVCISVESIYAQVSEEDSLALVELYDSTDGDNWTNNTNWNSGPVSTWYGVNVYNGRVRDLNLYNNNLNGTIPSSIGNLSSLQILYLDNNQLRGSIPPEIGNLSNLTYLFLYSNQLTGSIPPEIGNLSNLQLLYLFNNQLTGSIPPEIGNLSNLIYLYLADNQLTGSIPPEIGNLSNLIMLALSSNQLTGTIPSEIGNLSNLIMLHLGDNQLTGTIPTEIGNLSNLLMLYLADNQLIGTIPPEIGNLSNLGYLYLHNNQLTGAIPTEIGNLSNLIYLFLYDNKLTDMPDISSLTSLICLEIQNNKFTFEDIEPNINVSDTHFIYSPQDSVGESKDTIITKGANLTMSVSVGGENNLYQWKKDGSVISGATDTSYTISSVSISDAGSYTCEITNTVVTELTLSSRPVNVAVPYITVTSPNGGEVWQADSTYDITWTSVAATGNVRIEYSINNGFSWIQVAGSTVDDGSHSWMVPDNSSDSCLIRVKNWSGDPFDISNSVFSILPSSSSVSPVNLPEVYSFNVKGITENNHFEIRYALPEKAEYKLEVYDIKGTKVNEFSGESPAGFYSRKIDMSGKPTGVYFIRMEANGKKFTKTDKVLLVK